MKIKIQILIAILLSFLFLSVFVRSDIIYDGLQTTRYFYFFITSSLIIALISIISIFSYIKKAPLKIELEFNLTDILVVSFLFYSFIRLLYSDYQSWDNEQFITFFFLVILYFIWKYVFNEGFKENQYTKSVLILIIAFLSCGALEALTGILQLYDIIPGYVGSYFKVNGTFVNPDYFAGYLISVAPFAFGVYNFSVNKILKHIALVTFLLSIFILPSIYIRSSWLALFGGLIYILYYRYSIKSKLQVIFNSNFKKIILAASIFIIIFLSAFSLHSLKPDSANGRLLIWKISGMMIKDNSIFGIGYDRFETDYNIYQAEYFVDNSDDYEELLADNVNRAHNEYLQIWSETGIIGLVLWLGIFISALSGFSANNGRVSAPPRFFSVSAKSSIISILIYAFFSFPLHILPIHINLMFLLSIASAGSASKKIKVSNRKLLTFFAVCFIIISIIFIKKSINGFLNYKEWNEANTLVYPGLYTNAIEKFEGLYPNLKNNGEFLFNYGGVLTLNGNYKEAIPLLNNSKNNYTDPKQYINLGLCYEGLNDF